MTAWVIYWHCARCEWGGRASGVGVLDEVGGQAARALAHVYLQHYRVAPSCAEDIEMDEHCVERARMEDV